MFKVSSLPNIKDNFLSLIKTIIKEREVCKYPALAESKKHIEKIKKMSDEEKAQECGRCLRCDHFGYGLFRGGRQETW